MHPFGGTPICPRCSKAVYAAEQIMGPGRKLYHKPCLTCLSCGKRLDSYNLVEHDQEPYCKNCHVKNFGTRHLGLANLPDKDDVLSSPPTSPQRGSFSPTRRTMSPPTNGSPQPLPVRRYASGAPAPPPMLKPTRTFSPNRTFNSSPVRSTFSQNSASSQNGSDLGLAPEEDAEDGGEPVAASTRRPVSFPTHTGRVGGLPRTVPLTLSPSKGRSVPPPPSSNGDSVALTSPTTSRPFMSSTVGTRYGIALGGAATPLSPALTGLGAGKGPSCGRCGKTVYFAEQVKAIGKTWHKGCLRCTECGTTLDSAKLTEREGSPYCKRCYGKLYGPQGAGYALLGKAGG